MTRTDSTHPHGQPTLSDLMVRFLATRSDAAAAAVEPASGEVEPHEVAAGFRVDPRAAWTDAALVLQHAPALPPDWSCLVNHPAPAFAVALAAGSFPQRVKDLHPLLAKFEAIRLRPQPDPGAVSGCPGLRSWIEWPQDDAEAKLLAAGVARALGDFDRSAVLLSEAEGLCAGKLHAVWENEQAALAWHRGDCDTALARWQTLPDTPAVLFNRGMALLFSGRPVEARSPLKEAAAALPETSGWNALARLYLAVAEMHG
jgi:tetratricopeptide (TPR) repeat protein